MKVVLLSALGIFLYGIGEILSKKYANTGSIKTGAVAIVVFGFVTYIWLLVLRLDNRLAILATIWDLLYIIITVIIGVAMFKEQLNAYNYVGLALAAGAIVLLCK